MILLLFILAYALIGLLVAGRTAALLAWSLAAAKHRHYPSLYGEMKDGIPSSPNGDQWFGAGMIGLLAGAVWPIVGLGYLSRNTVLAPPSNVKQAQQKRANALRLEEQRKEIAELDRQLEIGSRTLNVR